MPNLKISFSGREPNEQVPTVGLYLLDKSGRIQQKLGSSKDGSLSIAAARDHEGATLALGPDVADIAQISMESLLQFRPSQQLPIWEKEDTIDILPPYWRGWNHFRICVGGRIRRCRPFFIEERPFSLYPRHFPIPEICYPICNGVVEVWTRTCCCRPPILIDLSAIIARMKQEVSYNPIQFPPHNPGDPGPEGAMRRKSADDLARAKALGSARLMAAPNTRLGQDLFTLQSLQPEQALAYFNDNLRLWPFWCHCSTGKIGETPLGPDGSFHFCYNRLPLLQLGLCSTLYYYVVRQWQDTHWVTIYDGAAAHQYFTANEFADLETWSGRSCGQTTPPPGTDFATLQEIGSTGAWALNSHYMGEDGAQNDLTQTSEFGVAPPPPDGGLVTANGAPWAQTLSFMLYFHPALEAMGAHYYRMSIAQADLTGNAVGTPQPITNPVAWSYFVQTGPTTWDIVSYSLGPNVAGGQNGLYEFPTTTTKIGSMANTIRRSIQRCTRARDHHRNTATAAI